jgi:hypothetical protein
MTAPSRIEALAWGDLRFATLARLCGLGDADHALIKCAKIWSWQTDHYTPEAPTYVVSVDLVEAVLGTDGGAHLVRARLAEETPDGLRMRGSKGRIEWLWKLRNASPKGGEATKRKHDNKAGPHGQPDARPSAQPKPGLLPPDPSPDPQISDSPAARAIQPSTGYDPDKATDRGRLAESMYSRIAAAREELIAELGLVDEVPMPRGTFATEPAGFRDLRDRIRGEGSIAPQACDRIVDALVRQAREERSVEWLSDKAFTEGAWRTARNGGSGKRQQPRAGPRRAGDLIGAATPRNDHPEGVRLIPINEIRVPRP